VIVSGSEIRLKQIIVNLLDNAIKYTCNGKRITLIVQSHEGKAIVGVSDEGIGIPADSLPHVTERFYRANKARSRDTSGGGLGLSIVEAISRAHAGELHIESQEGVGTNIRFEMPLAHASLLSSGSETPTLSPIEMPNAHS
jgi:signal transduction histidine kinase